MHGSDGTVLQDDLTGNDERIRQQDGVFVMLEEGFFEPESIGTTLCQTFICLRLPSLGRISTTMDMAVLPCWDHGGIIKPRSSSLPVIS